MKPARFLTALLIAAVPVTSQSGEWKIPDPGGAVFNRKHESKIGGGDKKATFPGLPRAVPAQHIIFRSEFDPKGRRMMSEPTSVVDLVTWLAFDMKTLRGRKKIKEMLPPMKPFGFIQLKGDVLPPDRDSGVQRIEVRATKIEPPRSVGRLPRGQEGQFRENLDVLISIERQVDKDVGVVKVVESTIEGSFTTGAKSMTVEINDVWTFERFVNRGPHFDVAVATAIAKGREYILGEVKKKLKKLGAPPPRGKNHAVDHAGGELALQLLTLIKSGYGPHHIEVKQGLDLLRKRAFHDTYSLGVALMLFEAVYANPNERQHLLDGLIDKPQPRIPSEEDKKLMQEWVTTLISNRDSRPDPAYLSRWTYNGGPNFDNSNTQYALLGLWSAKLCGVEIPTQIWWASANHWIDTQCKDEGQHGLRTLTHRAMSKGVERPKTTSRVPAAGWSYRGKNEAAYGSMTTAGIAGLTICAAALREDGANGRKLGEYRTAVRKGHAWLAKNFDVRNNPKRPGAWPHYYLYGLERACELSQVAWLDDHDWYFEGATILLEAQAENGSFRGARGAPGNCFAILFLKKVSVPVFTGNK